MKLILVAFLLFFSVQAKAGILVEPYLGYQAMLTELTFGAGTPGGPAFEGLGFKVDGTGMGFGIRAGYALPLIFAAIDYSSASLKGVPKNVPAGPTITENTQARTSLGVTVGASLPMLRPYVGYIFNDQGKDDIQSLTGSGFKVGIGFSFIPKISLNAEYQTLTYTKYQLTGGTETSTGSSAHYKEVKTSGFGVNLSVPFEF